MLKNDIIEIAKKYDADFVGFASAESFSPDDNIFKIFPDTKTVITLGFRVLRGIYRGAEEGTTFYQYTTMGVENLEETVMPLAMLGVCNVLEDEDYYAFPQKNNQLIMESENETNPEMDYTEIMRGVKKELQIDFKNAAVKCGIGERGLHGAVLTDEFGPFQRFCCILTDAEIEADEIKKPHLCDGCKECVKACHGNAIKDNGVVDSWKCAVYYNGANRHKNPFMPPEAFEDFKNKQEIIDGVADFNSEEAKQILDNIYFYPPAKHSYRTSICARACDRACYIHLEEKGVLTKKFARPFREGKDWKLD